MIERGRWSEQDKAQLRKMRAAGSSWSEIAQALGRSQMSVEVRAAEIKRNDPISVR